MGFYEPTNDIRVFTIKSNLYNTKHEVNFFKSVPKQGTIIADTMRAHCVKAGDYASHPYFNIGITGSLISASGGSKNLFAARFNTKSNFTSWYQQSDNEAYYESALTVQVDQGYEQIYICAEVNTNIYEGRTVYKPSDFSSAVNPNVAVVAYDFELGHRNWVSLLGDKEYEDYFSGMAF